MRSVDDLHNTHRVSARASLPYCSRCAPLPLPLPYLSLTVALYVFLFWIMVVENPATADFETTKGVRVIESFEDMGLKDELLRGIYDFGTCFRCLQGHLESSNV